MYIPVRVKFSISFFIAISWFLLCFWISLPWINDLASIITFIPAVLVVFSIALLPGFIYMFLIVSYLIDKRPVKIFDGEYPPVTIMIAAYNESQNIVMTLNSILAAKYPNAIEILLIDDGSTDDTVAIATELNIPNLKIINADHQGKAGALTKGLTCATNELIVTIDADTYLWSNSILEIVTKYLTSPPNTVAVAGSVYVRNSRENWITRAQEWDYFHSIAVIKRTQSLFQGTLVAQGAFSLYLKTILVEAGGWPHTVGEDIVMTWGFLKKGYRIDFAEKAISFTNVPDSYKSFFYQRSRWARGLLEAFVHHPSILFKMRLSTFYVYWNIFFVVSDFVFLIAFIPGVIAAFFGYFLIAGPLTLAILPLGIVSNLLFFLGQRELYNEFGLKVRRNKLGFFIYFILYPFIMNPAVIHGYLLQFFRMQRSWGTK